MRERRVVIEGVGARKRKEYESPGCVIFPLQYLPRFWEDGCTVKEYERLIFNIFSFEFLSHFRRETSYAGV